MFSTTIPKFGAKFGQNFSSTFLNTDNRNTSLTNSLPSVSFPSITSRPFFKGSNECDNTTRQSTATDLFTNLLSSQSINYCNSNPEICNKQKTSKGSTNPTTTTTRTNPIKVLSNSVPISIRNNNKNNNNNNNNDNNGEDGKQFSPNIVFLQRILWIKQQFRLYRLTLAQRMSAKSTKPSTSQNGGGGQASGIFNNFHLTSAACSVSTNSNHHLLGKEKSRMQDAETRSITECAKPKPLISQGSQKCLSVSQIVRQQSENIHNHRRLNFSRSQALFDDEEIASTSDVSSCDRRLTVSYNSTKLETDTNLNGMSSILSSNLLQRPTRLVTVVDQQANENYIQLNQYRLMEEIGQGSYGIVKLAYNERDKNLYAMKVLDKIKLVKNFACFRPPPVRRNKAQPSAVHRYPLQLVQREIAILKKLRHPNVVKLVEVLDDPNDNYLYMVFEYLEHRSLLDLPTDNPLDEPTAWKYFRDTLKGLEYLHFQKIVHRDIKPSNLLLSETGRVKIADFGVSCEFEGIDAFLTGTAGTPAFMAPEALSEESSLFYSGRAQDIWSLGITLYALIYGNVPFWDAYVIALHKKIKTEPVSFPESPEISAFLRELILGMLKKDPGYRLLLQEIKLHNWVTQNGKFPMPSEEENCHLVTVTEEEIENCVRVIPRLDTLILVKAMGHRKRFGNPFRTHRSANASQSLKFRRKSSSVRDPLYSGSNSSSMASPSTSACTTTTITATTTTAVTTSINSNGTLDSTSSTNNNSQCKKENIALVNDENEECAHAAAASIHKSLFCNFLNETPAVIRSPSAPSRPIINGKTNSDDNNKISDSQISSMSSQLMTMKFGKPINNHNITKNSTAEKLNGFEPNGSYIRLPNLNEAKLRVNNPQIGRASPFKNTEWKLYSEVKYISK